MTKDKTLQPLFKPKHLGPDVEIRINYRFLDNIRIEITNPRAKDENKKKMVWNYGRDKGLAALKKRTYGFDGSALRTLLENSKFKEVLEKLHHKDSGGSK